jgi:hypothetical protein
MFMFNGLPIHFNECALGQLKINISLGRSRFSDGWMPLTFDSRFYLTENVKTHRSRGQTGPPAKP